MLVATSWQNHDVGETQPSSHCICTSAAENGWKEAPSHAKWKFKITNLPWFFHAAQKSYYIFLALLLSHDPRLLRLSFPPLKPSSPLPWFSLSTDDPDFSFPKRSYQKSTPTDNHRIYPRHALSLLLTHLLFYSRKLLLGSPISFLHYQCPLPHCVILICNILLFLHS